MKPALKLTLILFLILALPAFYGCPGSGTPKITLTVTDCDPVNITISDSTRVTMRAGSQWILNTEITVKCNGNVVKDAEIKVDFWWPNGTFKLTTDENGKAHYRKTGQGTKPSGKKFQVTINGNGDDKTVEFTVP
jgi:hypothetical protein